MNEKSYKILRSQKDNRRESFHCTENEGPLFEHHTTKSLKRFRKKSAVLDTIANNIEPNPQNLNNPQQFYSCTFSKIKNTKVNLDKKLDTLIDFLKEI